MLIALYIFSGIIFFGCLIACCIYVWKKQREVQCYLNKEQLDQVLRSLARQG